MGYVKIYLIVIEKILFGIGFDFGMFEKLIQFFFFYYVRKFRFGDVKFYKVYFMLESRGGNGFDLNLISIFIQDLINLGDFNYCQQFRFKYDELESEF